MKKFVDAKKMYSDVFENIKQTPQFMTMVEYINKQSCGANIDVTNKGYNDQISQNDDGVSKTGSLFLKNTTDYYEFENRSYDRISIVDQSDDGSTSTVTTESILSNFKLNFIKTAIGFLDSEFKMDDVRFFEDVDKQATSHVEFLNGCQIFDSDNARDSDDACAMSTDARALAGLISHNLASFVGDVRKMTDLMIWCRLKLSSNACRIFSNIVSSDATTFGANSTKKASLSDDFKDVSVLTDDDLNIFEFEMYKNRKSTVSAITKMCELLSHILDKIFKIYRAINETNFLFYTRVLDLLVELYKNFKRYFDHIDDINWPWLFLNSDAAEHHQSENSEFTTFFDAFEISSNDSDNDENARHRCGDSINTVVNPLISSQHSYARNFAKCPLSANGETIGSNIIEKINMKGKKTRKTHVKTDSRATARNVESPARSTAPATKVVKAPSTSKKGSTSRLTTGRKERKNHINDNNLQINVKMRRFSTFPSQMYEDDCPGSVNNGHKFITMSNSNMMYSPISNSWCARELTDWCKVPWHLALLAPKLCDANYYKTINNQFECVKKELLIDDLVTEPQPIIIAHQNRGYGTNKIDKTSRTISRVATNKQSADKTNDGIIENSKREQATIGTPDVQVSPSSNRFKNLTTAPTSDGGSYRYALFSEPPPTIRVEPKSSNDILNGNTFDAVPNNDTIDSIGEPRNKGVTTNAKKRKKCDARTGQRKTIGDDDVIDRKKDQTSFRSDDGEHDDAKKPDFSPTTETSRFDDSNARSCSFFLKFKKMIERRDANYLGFVDMLTSNQIPTNYDDYEKWIKMFELNDADLAQYSEFEETNYPIAHIKNADIFKRMGVFKKPKDNGAHDVSKCTEKCDNVSTFVNNDGLSDYYYKSNFKPDVRTKQSIDDLDLKQFANYFKKNGLPSFVQTTHQSDQYAKDIDHRRNLDMQNIVSYFDYFSELEYACYDIITRSGDFSIYTGDVLRCDRLSNVSLCLNIKEVSCQMNRYNAFLENASTSINGRLASDFYFYDMFADDENKKTHIKGRILDAFFSKKADVPPTTTIQHELTWLLVDECLNESYTVIKNSKRGRPSSSSQFFENNILTKEEFESIYATILDSVTSNIGQYIKNRDEMISARSKLEIFSKLKKKIDIGSFKSKIRSIRGEIQNDKKNKNNAKSQKSKQGQIIELHTSVALSATCMGLRAYEDGIIDDSKFELNSDGLYFKCDKVAEYSKDARQKCEYDSPVSIPLREERDAKNHRYDLGLNTHPTFGSSEKRKQRPQNRTGFVVDTDVENDTRYAKYLQTNANETDSYKAYDVLYSHDINDRNKYDVKLSSPSDNDDDVVFKNDDPKSNVTKLSSLNQSYQGMVGLIGGWSLNLTPDFSNDLYLSCFMRICKMVYVKKPKKNNSTLQKNMITFNQMVDELCKELPCIPVCIPTGFVCVWKNVIPSACLRYDVERSTATPSATYCTNLESKIDTYDGKLRRNVVRRNVVVDSNDIWINSKLPFVGMGVHMIKRTTLTSKEMMDDFNDLFFGTENSPCNLFDANEEDDKNDEMRQYRVKSDRECVPSAHRLLKIYSKKLNDFRYIQNNANNTVCDDVLDVCFGKKNGKEDNICTFDLKYQAPSLLRCSVHNVIVAKNGEFHAIHWKNKQSVFNSRCLFRDGQTMNNTSLNGTIFVRPKRLNPSSKLDQRTFNNYAQSRSPVRASGVNDKYVTNRKADAARAVRESKHSMATPEEDVRSSRPNANINGGVGKVTALYGYCSPFDFDIETANLIPAEIYAKIVRYDRKIKIEKKQTTPIQHSQIKKRKSKFDRFDVLNNSQISKQISKQTPESDRELKYMLPIANFLADDAKRCDDSEKVTLRRLPSFNIQNSKYSLGNMMRHEFLHPNKYVGYDYITKICTSSVYATLDHLNCEEKKNHYYVFFKDNDRAYYAPPIDNNRTNENIYRDAAANDDNWLNNVNVISQIMKSSCNLQRVLIPNVYARDNGELNIRVRLKISARESVDLTLSCDLVMIYSILTGIRYYTKHNADISYKSTAYAKRTPSGSLNLGKKHQVRKSDRSIDTCSDGDIVCVALYNSNMRSIVNLVQDSTFLNQTLLEYADKGYVPIQRKDLFVEMTYFKKITAFTNRYDRFSTGDEPLVKWTKTAYRLDTFLSLLENDRDGFFLKSIRSVEISHNVCAESIQFYVSEDSSIEQVRRELSRLISLLYSNVKSTIVTCVVSKFVKHYHHLDESKYWFSNLSESIACLKSTIATNTVRSSLMIKKIKMEADTDAFDTYHLKDFITKCLSSNDNDAYFVHFISKMNNFRGYLDNLTCVDRYLSMLNVIVSVLQTDPSQSAMNVINCFDIARDVKTDYDTLDFKMHETTYFRKEPMNAIQQNSREILKQQKCTLALLVSIIEMVRSSDHFSKKMIRYG